MAWHAMNNSWKCQVIEYPRKPFFANQIKITSCRMNFFQNRKKRKLFQHFYAHCSLMSFDVNWRLLRLIFRVFRRSPPQCNKIVEDANCCLHPSIVKNPHSAHYFSFKAFLKFSNNGVEKRITGLVKNKIVMVLYFERWSIINMRILE